MTKQILVATIPAAEGKASELEAALQVLVAAAEEEEGLEVYAVAVDDTSSVFHFFEVYENAEALAAHGRGDRMKSSMRALGGLLGAAPKVTQLRPVAAKGVAF